MKNVLRLPALATLVALLAFTGCSKEGSIAPNNKLSQQGSSNGTILDLRNTEFDFPGLNTYAYTGYPVGLTGLPGTVTMVRKNFIEAANGDKIFSTWNSKAPLNPTNYPGISFPHQWTGKFYDHDNLTLGKVFDVVFQVDKFGNATATLKWNGDIVDLNLPYTGL